MACSAVVQGLQRSSSAIDRVPEESRGFPCSTWTVDLRAAYIAAMGLLALIERAPRQGLWHLGQGTLVQAELAHVNVD